MKHKLIYIALIVFTVIASSSCRKTNYNTVLVIQNNIFTPLQVTINNQTATIPVGQSASFVGAQGAYTSGQATSSGSTSDGAAIGLTLSWSLNNYQFPPSGSTIIPIDLSPDYFFLYMKNTSLYDVIKLYVNFGLADQTIDNITILNDGYLYPVGYYHAWSNSNVSVDMSNSTIRDWTSLNLPFSYNQSFTAWVSN